MNRKKLSSAVLIPVCLVFAAGCARYMKIRLSPSVYYSFSLKDEKGHFTFASPDQLSPFPSEFCIRGRDLFISDSGNSRVLGFDRKGRCLLTLTNRGPGQIRLEFAGSNMILQPLAGDERLLSLNQPGQVLADDDFIYVENILGTRDEETPERHYSLILKYNRKGEPAGVVGVNTREGFIYPFVKLEKMSLDLNGDLFVFIKLNDAWAVRKYGRDGKFLYEFNSAVFYTNSIAGGDKDVRIIIEDMDHSNYGDFLLIVAGHFRKDVIFEKAVYYRLDLKDNRLEKLFTLRNERLNFILLDHSNLVNLIRTLDAGENESIILSLCNLKGQVVRNYQIGFNRREAQWLNFKVQKDRILAGLCIRGNRLNVMRWR